MNYVKPSLYASILLRLTRKSIAQISLWHNIMIVIGTLCVFVILVR
jgi:hypothetical protein